VEGHRQITIVVMLVHEVRHHELPNIREALKTLRRLSRARMPWCKQRTQQACHPHHDEQF
jgi:hypothetical protein